MAAWLGHVRVLAVLIRHGVDINDGSTERGTALHHAAEGNKADAIDVLVAAGADTEARNAAKETPLHFATRMLGLKSAAALLRHGAVINARDRLKHSPLHIAAREAGKRGAAEMVDLLLRWGADETFKDHDGYTPADVAEGYCCCDIEEVGRVERVLRQLEHAPVAREAWCRRGWLVASRARPQMISLRTGTQSPREWVDLMSRVPGLVEEGVFRTIVGYL